MKSAQKDIKPIANNHIILAKSIFVMILFAGYVSPQSGEPASVHGASQNQVNTAEQSAGCEHKSGQTVVSPFAGSETVGEYLTDFDKLILAENSGGNLRDVKAEGCFTSHIYKKPENRSAFEVYKSYERELKAAGFTIMAGIDNRVESTRLTQHLYGRGNNWLSDRNYVFTKKRPNLWVLPFSQQYLSAKRVTPAKITYVALMMTWPGTASYGHEYIVDILETAPLQSGNVTISAEVINQKISSVGSVAIYNIYFDTDKAEILPSSNDALSAIAAYLKANPAKKYYVVGHTDDTGGLTHNMDLSNRRATAVNKALISDFGVSPGQLEPLGVGPAAPVAANASEEGRSLNRRVELVLRLNQ